ncbi:hypothetical protein PIB30_040019 [Stylosanthes scabra]|uniref:Pentatricopeptide repeat-containing protein n=1 Tax=Stylosanthes scabra TaxID=79078 RepID=A0ABU6QDV4_9FABA|nr:hypothetical protein [Stylosanthes scabra]
MFVQNSLVNAYSICGDNVSACKVFDEMPVRDVVSWNGLISGYVKAGLFEDSISLFLRMDVEPNVAIIVCILGACAKLGGLNLGKGVHGLVVKYSYGKELMVGNAVMNMYMKCESVADARRVFDEMSEKDVISWTSFEPDVVILTNVLSAATSLRLLDYGRWVHEYINQAVSDRMFPLEQHWLTSCCYSGLIDEGRRLFDQMTSPHYNLSPGLEHYGCMVDKDNAMPPDVQIIGSLLGACSTYKNVGFCQEILKSLENFEYEGSGIYVRLSNLYAANKKWTEVRSLRKQMRKKGISKAPGSSIIRVDGKSHEFLVGDSTILKVRIFV